MLDSSLILSLNGAGALGALAGNARYDWVITPLVRGELTTKADRDAIDAMIAAGTLRLVELDTTNPAEMAEWTAWAETVDDGEAEGIALAVSRGWLIALEDRKAQRALDRKAGKGRWINCANVLKEAVADGRLSLASADGMFAALDCYSAYSTRKITSLSQL